MFSRNQTQRVPMSLDRNLNIISANLGVITLNVALFSIFKICNTFHIHLPLPHFSFSTFMILWGVSAIAIWLAIFMCLCRQR